MEKGDLVVFTEGDFRGEKGIVVQVDSNELNVLLKYCKTFETPPKLKVSNFGKNNKITLCDLSFPYYFLSIH
jgi:ribosomal protein L24